jgi:hypothetical protein
VADKPWERARLIPVSGISGPDEQERRGVSALLAVVNSVREFGRAITGPLGAPAGGVTAFIEVPFTSGEKNLRPDGVLQVKRGTATWTALVEVKTGTNELRTAQVESYLDVAREQGFNAVVTISNQLVGAPGEHPVTVDKRKLRNVSLHHLSWSQIRTEALVEQANKSVSDPDQAWILAEFIRYLEHPRSGAAEFDDMGPSWVTVREAARAGTLQAADKGAVDVVRRFGHLVSFAAMLLSRELGVEVRPALSRADVKEPGKRVQAAAAALAETGILSGGLRVPNAAATIEITADLRSSRIRSAITVDAPAAGKSLTRLNWLLRQLRDTPGSVYIEAIAVRQRGMGPVKTIAQVRETPRLLVEDPKRDLRAFTVSLSANAGTKRGKGRGSFVLSVLDTVDSFYADVVQHIKPWTPPPVKVPDDEPPRDDDQDTPGHATHLAIPSTPNGDLRDLVQASSAD